MNRTVVKGCLALVAVAVVSSASYYLWESRYSGSARVMNQVRVALVDPESARFQDVRAYPETNGGCGLVNARNRMGGYTGFTRFIALSGGEVIFGPLGDDGTGTAQARLDLAEKELAFIKRALVTCPDPDRN
jgi:hypothetical protein